MPTEKHLAAAANGVIHVAFDRPASRYPVGYCAHSYHLPGRRMTPQDKTIEADRRRAVDAAHDKATEHAKNSPYGMRITAQGLRDRASSMSDAGDRTTMLHIASEYERRATELEERITTRRTK